ncbi:P-loop NTPase [Calditerrivibrio nitroreducens]|uniref:P-loop NTPase n=1 Tax=Calditerrivibrio nitroreducens TaxID=477976 RepID=UPI003C71DAD8
MDKNTTVISVASGKGGVGKSNFSLNLSLSIAEQGKPTALFDADLSLGNASLLIGSNPQKTILNLIEDDVTINDIIFKSKRYENFFLIPAGTGITKLTNLTDKDKTILTNKINEFKSKIEFLIIDTAAGASDEVVHFIAMSDILIVVIIPEITSIKDAYGLLKILKEKGIVKKTYIVINKAKSKTQVINIFDKFEETVKKFLEIDVELLGPIPYNIKIPEAVNNQTPILYYEPEGSTSALFRQFANLLINNKIANKDMVSFLSKLFLSNNTKEDQPKKEESDDIHLDNCLLSTIEQNIEKILEGVNHIQKTFKINLRRDNISKSKQDYFSDFQVGHELIFVEKDSYFVSSKILGWDFGNYIFVKINNNLLNLLENLSHITARYSYQDKLIEFKTHLLHKPTDFDEIVIFSYPKRYTETSLRGSKRYSVNLSSIMMVNNNASKCKMIDLNLNGALIESEIPLSIGDILKLSFVLPDGKLIENIICKVKNIRNSNRYGVSFETISPLALKRLNDFLDVYDKITAGKGSLTETKKTSGNFENISPMDLVQVLSFSNKTCLFEMFGNDYLGKIYFEKGSVVHAECQKDKGLDAFYKLMEVEEGDFNIVDIPAESIPAKTIGKSTNQLLLDAAFLIDTKRNLKNKNH